MNCEASEQAIFDSTDGVLTPEDRAALREHLSGCIRCRKIAVQAQRLDASLSGKLASVSVSADFEFRLKERIHRESVPLASSERVARMRQAEEEYAVGMERLNQGWLDPYDIAEWLGFTLTVAGGIWLGWYLFAQWASQPGAGLPIIRILAGILSIALCLVAGLLAACPSARRRLPMFLAA